jgi:lipoprotein-anchoring transpeptidase ErfK/SrfK
MAVPRTSCPAARWRIGAAMLSAVAAATTLAGCTATGNGNGGTATEPGATPAAPTADVTANVRKGATVQVDKLVKVTVEDGTLRSVRVTSPAGRVPGTASADKTSWAAQERLEPGSRYQVTAVAENTEGRTSTLRRSFRTAELTLDQQTYASVAPLDGETVGVGMPVIVSFDIPVTDRAAIERHLRVSSRPAQAGSWHWISDTEVHWRPRTYWKPGSRVLVTADINGVDAGNGIYGQEDRVTRFTVGDAVIMKVDAAAHTMRVTRNGELLRTIPISAGKPGYTTRSGVKVVIEKFRTKTMDAATTGVSEDDPEYYNIEGVEYAQRVTYSGEFIHAAPWSVGSQGDANVSHGCVGMSTEAAAWLYSFTRRGDVVDVTGTDRRMEPTNGYGDWNVPWREYRAGSAL